jgi:hypothetical protein
MDERLNLPSGSGAEIWMNCPAQPAFVKDLPGVVEEIEETTLSGIRIHDALRTGSTLELSEDETETYKLAVKNEESLLAQWCQDKGITTFNEGPRESRCYLHDAKCGLVTSGQLDRHWIAPPYLLIEDYKSQYCWNLIPSHKNKQLRIYAVLGWQEYDGIEHVRVALNKPKIKASPLDCTDYDRHDLEFSLQSILLDLWRTKQPDAQFNPGPWCNWCAGKAYCRAAGAYNLLPSVIARNGTVSVEEAVNTLSPDDLAKIWEGAAVRNKIEDAVKKRLKAMPDEQLAALGIERGKPKNLDPIVDVKGAFDIIKAMGVAEERIWTTLGMSKTELVKVLRNSLDMSAEKASKWKWIKESLAECIEKKQSEAALVKIK